MRIYLDNVGRKFNRDWIFREVSLEMQTGQVYVITGANGSGKSTLLQIIAGNLPLTEGAICYESDASRISDDSVFRYVSLASPYLELIEEFTLTEAVTFHQKFKTFRNHLSVNDFIAKIHLQAARHKPVKHFSSGMKTRLKLGLACYADTPVLLLDEPTSNLDATGISWYQHLLAETTPDRLVIICSNQPYEYEAFTHILHFENGRLIHTTT